MDRSLNGYTSLQNLSEIDLNAKKDKLFEILEGISQNNEDLSYYQGYHDVATIIMLIFGFNLGYHVSDRLANTFFRDELEISFADSVLIQIDYI